MPIVIYSRKGPPESPPPELAWLCDDEWTLPAQVYALEVWLRKHKRKIKKGSYVADIGFTVRKDASGGGSALSIEMMHTMAALGITLFLSEYPGVSRKTKSNNKGCIAAERSGASKYSIG
jgi:hypothetical protein